MFNFGNANSGQKEAISTSDGPVLITAGPGTGKTFTLVKRTLYLIVEKGIKPENIFIATFTEKAAKELVTRITNELADQNIPVNINDMYVGTFHSLCLRILKDHLEFTRLRKNYRLLDSFDQQYMIFQNFHKFSKIENVDKVLPKKGKWGQAEAICGYVNNLSEELVQPDDLIADKDEAISIIGNILKTYLEMLNDENLMDFSSIQVEAYNLLYDNPDILKELQAKISHIMVDEYQDTNFIQEQLVFLLAGKRKNICVVGDDDQGLYRFRGATIRNILEFPQKFSKGNCKIIPLNINYRSNSNIIDFYNRWMETTDGKKFKFEWENFRYDKRIEPGKKTEIASPAVIKISASNSTDIWHKKLLTFIRNLKTSGKLKDYNQIAFLFRSVKNPHVKDLADFLEQNGINVYSPRSNLFFERHEIKAALGCMMLMFPTYVKKLERGEHSFLQPEHRDYFIECIEEANGLLKNADLREWMRKTGITHEDLKGTLDYGYSGLLYRLFAFSPFSDILNTDLSGGVVDVRPARNLAMLTQIISKFEYLNKIDVLDAKKYKGERRIDGYTERLFNLYIKLLFDGGISEYEDDSEYAPSGCVSFLTIHQSKGMEFPVVLVDSLSSYPRTNFDELMALIEERYFKRPAFEPYETTKFFDFWRLYYTAFSRAQNLLVLTCNETNKTPSKYFKNIYGTLPSADSKKFNISDFDLESIKDVNIKKTFSFTSHISIYETCALQYKFYRELEFEPVRAGSMIFGSLVHETIEDIHRAAIRREEKTITPENIKSWFDANYASLSKSERSYLGEAQLNAALGQVLRYAKRQEGNRSAIQQAEVDVSLVKADYIIDGKIDLIRGEGDTVEIVDFKSEKKPDLTKQRDRLERYEQQLNIYAHLVEERTGKKVSKMHLYYTGEEDGVPTVTFPYKKYAVRETMNAFDETVRKIMRKDFSHCSKDGKVCLNCDFRYFCKKDKEK